MATSDRYRERVVSILDVPEPQGLSLEYEYKKYSPEESYRPDRTLRKITMSGTLPLPTNMPTGVMPPSIVTGDGDVNLSGESFDEISRSENNEEVVYSQEELLSYRLTQKSLLETINSAVDEWWGNAGVWGDGEKNLFQIAELGDAELDPLHSSEKGFWGTVKSLYSPAVLNVPPSTTSRAQWDGGDEQRWTAFSADFEGTQPKFLRYGLIVESCARPFWPSAPEPAPPVRRAIQLATPDPGGAFTIDFDALHGHEYTFRVRALWVAPLFSAPGEPSGWAFLSSKEIVLQIDTFKDERPSPPSDVKGVWDFHNSALMLQWNMPIDRPGVVKGLQLFKRRTIDEPYSLMRQWNWNDNRVDWPLEADESPPSQFVRKELQRGWFYDMDFEPRSGELCHYALVAITAHGINSLLSQQVTVVWRNPQVGVVNRLLARSGAPKQYPNLMLEPETESILGKPDTYGDGNTLLDSITVLSDVITLEGTGRVQIVLDPETRKVVNSHGDTIYDFAEGEWGVVSMDHKTLTPLLTLHATDPEELAEEELIDGPDYEVRPF